MEGVEYVLHEAALGSVPRSIKDPVTTNEVNISGFLNMIVAARDAGVRRFVFAASSSTYGDSKSLPKVEDVIGKPLSPYAITKYVDELYADVFARTYEGFEYIGLRYGDNESRSCKSNLQYVLWRSYHTEPIGRLLERISLGIRFCHSATRTHAWS